MTSSELEIGVWVEGVQKWVTGVTRRTTCHDVIKALLRAQSHGRAPEDCDVMQFVIVERWRKVERPLDHEQRILKVWRTWGEAVGEVRFSLRRVRDSEGSSGGVGGSSGRPERSRRRQKMKHAHGSRETLHPKKVAREDPKFSETMERLMRLVVAQGETIQAQLRRLQEREQQIEQYEQQMHLLRVQNLGTDYLLHSYLKDDPAEAKDDPGSEEKSNDSGVVTEEASDAAINSALESTVPGDDAMEGASDTVTEEILAILVKIEEVNTRLLHEEEALSGMTTAVTAAQEQQKDEAQLLQQELACVARIHAQLVADARNNEQTLRDTEVVLWQQRKQLEMLLQEDSESDMETRALREHLDYIIHLPPSAFLPPALPPESVPTPVPTVASSRVPPLTSCPGDHVTAIPPTRLPTNTVTVQEEDIPPPLPSCPPPIPTCPPPTLEEDEDDGDSARTGSLCVSSRSSTSSEASTGSSGISTTAPSTSLNKSSPSSSATNPSSTSATKQGDSGGKDTDSTDSNSDTGLSSLHSSSDEGVYVLDTLV